VKGRVTSVVAKLASNMLEAQGLSICSKHRGAAFLWDFEPLSCCHFFESHIFAFVLLLCVLIRHLAERLAPCSVTV